MKHLFLAAIILGAGATAAHAQEPPQWMSTVMPESVLGSTWQEHQAVYADEALDGKTKHLIALATAAQIPCEYCIIGHTSAAREAGATDQEIKEALAAAGQGGLAGEEADLGHARDMRGRPEQVDQGGEIVGPHVQHRTAADLVIALG